MYKRSADQRCRQKDKPLPQSNRKHDADLSSESRLMCTLGQVPFSSCCCLGAVLA